MEWNELRRRGEKVSIRTDTLEELANGYTGKNKIKKIRLYKEWMKKSRFEERWK